MSNVMIIVDALHPDGNSLQDIVNALADMGADVIHVDTQHHVIEALLPTKEIVTLEAFGGVAYVRPVFTYFAAERRTNGDEISMN